MATDTITIHLPDDLQHRLERLVALTGQPIEGLIVRTLSSNLPALPEDLPPTTRDALQALERLDDDDLRRYTHAMFPQDQYERFTALREERQERALTTAELAELANLTDSADLLTLQKAYAAVLLKWRSQLHTPPLTGDVTGDA